MKPREIQIDIGECSWAQWDEFLTKVEARVGGEEEIEEPAITPSFLRMWMGNPDAS